MPHPTSVTDVPRFVSLAWLQDDHLEVSVPDWAEYMWRKEKLGGIRITFVRNNRRYPGVTERHP
jgi:hypothetical protein